MTPKEFRKSIAASCKRSMSKHSLRYQDIKINYGLPTLAIGEYFFAQGEDADQFLGDCKTAAEATGLNIKTCLIWYLDSAGVL